MNVPVELIGTVLSIDSLVKAIKKHGPSQNRKTIKYGIGKLKAQCKLVDIVDFPGS